MPIALKSRTTSRPLLGLSRNHHPMNAIGEASRGLHFNWHLSRAGLTSGVATVLLSLSTAWAGEPAALTSLQAVHALSNVEADHAISAAFEATVVYSRGYESLLFVQDGDAALFVNPPANAEFLPGDRVFVSGKTQGSFRPLVVAKSIRLLHHGTLPKPAPATFDQLIRANFDCRLVTARATVRAADLVVSPVTSRRSARLQLVMNDGHVEANVDTDDDTAFKGLLDDEVEITGVAAGKFDNKMQQTGVILFVSNLSGIKVLKRVDTNFWSLPITPMDQILSDYHVRDMTHRAQVRGTVTYYLPGSAVVLQDGSKSLWVSTHTREPLQIGDFALASGFPDAHDRILTLTDAEIQDSHVPAPISPYSATWKQLAFWNSSKPDGRQYDLVSIEGRVITEVREATQDEYVLTSDGKLFDAIYRHSRGTGAVPLMRQVPLGATIRVTGICSILDTNAVNPGEEVPFNILLRSFDDIAVVERPSLLNVRNLSFLVLFLFALLFIGGIREWVRERKVRRHNATIAYVERRRSRILEDISGSRPLVEILEEITDLASFKLSSVPCWCQVADGAKLGNCPRDLTAFRVVTEPIPARSGPPLGIVSAAFHPLTDPGVSEMEDLSVAASLAALAIETRRLYSDLQYRSQFDLLTDIHNRFSLESFLERLIEQAHGDASIFGLIYIDLNDFKQVNDVYGHHVGDLYLQEAALRMKHELRAHDMLARLGGDEFAVVVSRVRSRKEVDEVAQRVERCFDPQFSFEGYVLRGSASVGVALFPEDGATRESLLTAADAAMYVAKQTRKHTTKVGSFPGSPGKAVGV